MAEILIKGMEMPKGGDIVKLYLCSDGRVVYQDCGRIYQRNAQELPSHGRLIDADVLKETLMKSAYPEQREWYFAEACQFIDEAPTII